MQYIIHLHQFEPQTYHDELFDLKERILLRSLQLRVRDYPGEDRYLFDTIKDLKDLKKKVILVFIMNLHWRNDALCDVVASENDRYFSKILVDLIDEHLKNISSVVSRVMIVFNKTDLLPPEWDDKQAFLELKKASPHATRHIEAVFNHKLEYHLISARTNKGIVKLLGDIGRTAIAQDRESKRFDGTLARLREFAVVKGSK